MSNIQMTEILMCEYNYDSKCRFEQEKGKSSCTVTLENVST